MIYIGNNEISNIYIGTDKMYGIYAGDLQIYPTKIILTAISLENLVWVTNIPASGGTATKENCTYSVTAYYSDGTTVDVTSEATITGSQVIPSTNIEEVHSAGTLTLTASYSGFTATGNVTVYQEAAVPDFSKKLLTFNILSAGTIVWKALNKSIKRTIEYKLNDGAWVSITSNTGRTAPKINVVEGDKIQFRGNNAEYGDNTYDNRFGGSTAKFSVEGNIMSLINKTNFENETKFRGSYNLRGLFSNCTGLTSAENLILPVTTLSEGCYVGMFSGCKSLTTAPELPATTLADSCYNGMFEGCTSLTTAPALPATKLAEYCYVSMFSNCSKLISAPELPATILAIGCYKSMFSNCSSLNYIKCLATSISARYCTDYWVRGVSSTGTFVKNPNMTSWKTGENGIPSGWTVINA